MTAITIDLPMYRKNDDYYLQGKKAKKMLGINHGTTWRRMLECLDLYPGAYRRIYLSIEDLRWLYTLKRFNELRNGTDVYLHFRGLKEQFNYSIEDFGSLLEITNINLEFATCLSNFRTKTKLH